VKQLTLGAVSINIDKAKCFFDERLDVELNVIELNEIVDAIKTLDSEKINAIVVSSDSLPFPRPFDLRIFCAFTSEENKIIAVIGKKKEIEVRKIFFELDERRRWGKVWIAGFGPGNADLLTIKTDRLCGIADAIFYDDLIDSDFLKKYEAEKIYVGKRKGRRKTDQNEINAELFSAARSGKRVVRLKGGDPFIFGRGGEELEYLSKRCIAVEVVPGVSAINAAAAEFGIPLTQRYLSSSLEIVSMHGRTSSNSTLVYYMSASLLNEVQSDLREKGIAGDTPVAIIRNASIANSEIVTTTVDSMEGLSVSSPALVIVGRTSAFASQPSRWLTIGKEELGLGFMDREDIMEDLSKFEKYRSYLNRYDGIAFACAENKKLFFEIAGELSGLLFYAPS